MRKRASNDVSLTYGRLEAFAELGVGVTTGDEMIRRGVIPSIRIGRRVLIPKTAVRQLVESALARGKAAS